MPLKKAPIHAPCYLEPNGEGHSGPAGSLDDRRPTRPCAHSRSSTIPVRASRKRLMFAPGNQFRLASLRASLRQGTKRTAGPSLAGDGVVAKIAAHATAEGRRRSPIFVNRYGVPLGASGCPLQTGAIRQRQRITPSRLRSVSTSHSFRHATAVHLVAAGVDVTVIEAGSAMSTSTPQPLRSGKSGNKRLALERLESPSRSTKRPSWKQDQSVLAWLDAL